MGTVLLCSVATETQENRPLVLPQKHKRTVPVCSAKNRDNRILNMPNMTVIAIFPAFIVNLLKNLVF